jgi:hypothetical protein
MVALGWNLGATNESREAYPNSAQFLPSELTIAG